MSAAYKVGGQSFAKTLHDGRSTLQSLESFGR